MSLRASSHPPPDVWVTGTWPNAYTPPLKRTPPRRTFIDPKPASERRTWSLHPDSHLVSGLSYVGRGWAGRQEYGPALLAMTFAPVEAWGTVPYDALLDSLRAAAAEASWSVEVTVLSSPSVETPGVKRRYRFDLAVDEVREVSRRGVETSQPPRLEISGGPDWRPMGYPTSVRLPLPDDPEPR